MAVAAAGAESAPAGLFSPAATRLSGPGRDAGPGVAGPPERPFPRPVIIGPGMFAGVTIGLVVLTALGGSGS